MLPGNAHEILIGTILGDACIERNGRFWRVRFDHGEKEREYVTWKYRQLKQFAISWPRRFQVKDKRTDRVYTHIRFDTESRKVFGYYYYLFYRNGKKIVSDKIELILKTPLALAVWYMDDGHRRTDCKALRINTHAYSKAEVGRLVTTLWKNFGVRSAIHRAVGKQFTIYIPANVSKGFSEIIRPHVLPCMKYKLL